MNQTTQSSPHFLPRPFIGVNLKFSPRFSSYLVSIFSVIKFPSTSYTTCYMHDHISSQLKFKTNFCQTKNKNSKPTRIANFPSPVQTKSNNYLLFSKLIIIFYFPNSYILITQYHPNILLLENFYVTIIKFRSGSNQEKNEISIIDLFSSILD